MDVDKVKKWIELTSQYQKNDFWTKLFEYQASNQFLNREKEFPKFEVYQDETHICLIIEVPGVNLEDLQIFLQSKSQLIIKGMIHPLFPSKMNVKEGRYYGEFERHIDLPEPTDAHFIQVHFHQGLLQIIYPRQNEAISLNLF